MFRTLGLRSPTAILIGISVMLSLSMGMRQSLGLFVQPAVKELSITVADFTLAVALQNLIWGVLQPFAGIWAAKSGSPKFKKTVLMSSAGPGAVLVDVLSADNKTVQVAADGSVDITLPAMSGVVLVPDSQVLTR